MLFLPALALVIQQPAVDLSTPEKALASFVAAFNKGERSAMVACVVDGKDTDAGMRFFDFFLDMKLQIAVQVQNKRKTSESEVVFEYHIKSNRIEIGSTSEIETVKLQKSNGQWKFVAPNSQKVVDQLGLLAMLMIVCAHPEVVDQVKTTMYSIVALSNMKSLGLAGMMYLLKNDEHYNLTQNNFSKLLMPFLKERNVFTSPLGSFGKISISINPNLTKESYAKLQNPEKTIWFFEGKVGKLNYRYNGKAVVVMCDGRARLVAPEEAKTFLWK